MSVIDNGAFNKMKPADKRELSKFLTNFSLDTPKLEAMRQGIEQYGATRFSPFAIFSPDENTLSRVVAELFDPRGLHGQGLLFVNALLQAIDFPRLGPRDPVRVRREAMTRRRRRIDIVIETRDYVIGIENKPWASQQLNQLSDYFDELSSDLKNRTPILIFLSDQEARTAKESVKRIPYYSEGGETSLYGLLNSLVDDIKAASPRAFVKDFLRYIKSTFGGDDMDDEADEARAALNIWRTDYNGARPHSKLGWQTPDEFALTFHTRRAPALRNAKSPAPAPAASLAHQGKANAGNELKTG